MTDRTLVLHIAIPGVNVDDWDDLVLCARLDVESEPTAADMGELFTLESIRSEVGITIVTLPGEKCMNDDFSVRSFNGRVVGASLLNALTEEGGDNP